MSQDGRILASTLPGQFDQNLPSPIPTDTLSLYLQDTKWLAAAAPLSEDLVLWLLKPRPGVLQTLGTQGWALLAVTL
ncbi:MAG: hypothetical protein II754_02940, partial [Lachnospiraceae bacterium]|nr:hypothetical protein [Lachnospiraceae bacterium]